MKLDDNGAPIICEYKWIVDGKAHLCIDYLDHDGAHECVCNALMPVTTNHGRKTANVNNN